MRDDLAEDRCPPPSGPKRFVRRLKNGQSKTFICISRTWWGVWTHWNGKSSQPHFRKKDSCDGCKKGMPRRWKGYLDVQNADDKQREFIELTPGMVEQIEADLPKGEPMRGQRFTVTRGKGDKARCQIHFLSHLSVINPKAMLPKEEDPKPILMSLWGYTELHALGDDTDMSVESSEAS